MKVRTRVTPRASRTRVRFADGVLRVWVVAPAVDGRANDAARAAIAEALSLHRSEVAIAAGERSRNKLVELPDRAAASLRALAAE